MSILLRIKNENPDWVIPSEPIGVGKITQPNRKPIQKKKFFRKSISGRFQTEGQFLRTVVQSVFLSLVVWIGIDFYRFTRYFETGGQTSWVDRPPGVEGFLPIGALISLSYWLQTGVINNIHPSGLFILIAVVAVSWLYQKAFCSWICPVGFISETLWMFGEKIFGRNLRLPGFIDWFLRSVKYFFLLFFVYAILQMNIDSLRLFIFSPYNKVADIKMMNFFRNISVFATWTLIIVAFLSMVIKNFWCRYLCPYGALTGLAGLLSPIKVFRNGTNCIDCGKCARACPSRLPVDRVSRVTSDECMACLACIDACPIRDTLELRTITKKRVPNWIFALAIVTTFAGITGTAMLTGHWRNAIHREEYQKRIQDINSPVYEHNRGRVPQYSVQD